MLALLLPRGPGLAASALITPLICCITHSAQMLSEESEESVADFHKEADIMM
jgi:hypothetical protein